MLQSATWQPHIMCGCKISITAEWPEYQNGITFRHPNQGTIQNISIISVCPNHISLNQVGYNPNDPYASGNSSIIYRPPGYMGSHQSITVSSVSYNPSLDKELQSALKSGYVRGSIQAVENFLTDTNRISYIGWIRKQPSSPAEHLYAYLYRFSGQLRHSPICECKWIDAFDTLTGSSISTPQYIEGHPMNYKCWVHCDDSGGVNLAKDIAQYNIQIKNASSVNVSFNGQRQIIFS